MSVWKRQNWSPYAVGAAIGVLSWGTFLFMGKALGTSTTMVRAAGMIEGSLAPEHVQANGYFAKYLVGKPGFEWQFALVLAMVAGAFLAARLSGSRPQPVVPQTWSKRFGDSRAVRSLGAFVGGVLLLFGARMAGGCTSGHGLSGGLQLSVSSWTFVASVFAVGIPFAFALYGRKEQH